MVGLLLVCSFVTLLLIGKPAVVPLAFVICGLTVILAVLEFMMRSRERKEGQVGQ